MRLPGDARHRPYQRVHNFGNAVLVQTSIGQQCREVSSQRLLEAEFKVFNLPKVEPRRKLRGSFYGPHNCEGKIYG